MIGHGVSYGAVTVINAMACGIGCTIGVDLRTTAVFDTDSNGKNTMILNDPSEDTGLARICVRRAFEYAGATEPNNWSLTVDSEIPPSRGLKSSSSAANAVLSAVFDCIGFKMDDLALVRLGVSCAREAGVTVTGSFDDACGCHFGGIVMTDNMNDTVIFRKDFEEMDVIISITDGKIRKKDLQLDRIRESADRVRELVSVADSDPFKAMTENGKIYSAAIGLDDSFAVRCLENGASAAGLSGSGPAVAALIEKGKGMELIEKIGGGRVILTHTRNGR